MIFNGDRTPTPYQTDRTSNPTKTDRLLDQKCYYKTEISKTMMFKYR